MTTERQRAALEAGRHKFTDEDRRRGGRTRAEQKAAEDEERYRDPDDVLGRMYFAAARAAERAYDRYNGQGREDRNLVDLSRECRMLADAYLEALREEGAVGRADAFVTKLADAIAASPLTEEGFDPWEELYGLNPWDPKTRITAADAETASETTKSG